MATLTDIEGTNTVPENNDITQENFEIINEVKVESDSATDFPALGSVLDVNKLYIIGLTEYNNLVSTDPNTIYFVIDGIGGNSGIYAGSVPIANLSTPCP